MKIGFALITSEPFFSNVIELENKYHNKAGFYDVLGDTNNIPHTTLFQGEMLDSIKYTSIANDIAEYYALISNNDFSVVFNNIEYIPTGWYFWECEKTEILTKLHRYVLDKVSSYIVLDEQRLKRNTDELTEKQFNAILKYGYRYAGDAFYPHITVGKNNLRQEIILHELNEEIKKLPKRTTFDCVTVYEMGINGVHKNTLYKRILE